jgi:hypothetical protein
MNAAAALKLPQGENRMFLSKGWTRLGLVAAVASLMLTLSLAVANTASAQTPPATFYGRGLQAGSTVQASIGGTVCGSSTVNSAGEWSISVPTTAPCNPTEGAAVTFTVNGAPATATPAAVWRGGGLPPDVANGYVLAPASATATATTTPTVVAPKTGNAGMLGGEAGAASTWVVLGIALLALGTVAGTRAYAGRAR